MSSFVADLHIHSRYSRACSKDLAVSELAKWAKIKGISVLGTGDFTHPLWLNELKDTLRETSRGLFEYDGVDFMLTAEVNTLFYKGGKAHQVHQLIFAPSLEAVERINAALGAFGSLSLDGRPMLRMEAWRLVELVLGLEPRCMIVPAHVWTPWFGLFGSRTGFDAIEECFERQTQHIYAMETGLSSDPAMSWRLKALDRYTLISNSDAHSARRIGREANVFGCERTYDAMTETLRQKDATKLLSTVEFFPEEGKYHFDGHRACHVRLSPQETKQHNYRCPTCGRRVTVGVMHRVDALADMPEGRVPEPAIPFTRAVPLEEIIAEALEVGVGTKTVERDYFQLIDRCGTEFNALFHAPEETLRRATSERIADGILRVRTGNILVEPGYDGEYGTVRVFMSEPEAVGAKQITLFGD